ncbi:MAG: hypothetical protein QME76_08985 [Bacillota bacterium]|nr:hypothetical protein [Bacillota bacterium]
MNKKKWLLLGLTVALLFGSVGCKSNAGADGGQATDTSQQAVVSEAPSDAGTGRAEEPAAAGNDGGTASADQDRQPKQGAVPGGGPRGGPMADVAGILGMTAEELQTALKAGKTLEQAAADKGMTLAQLKEKLLAETKARLDEEVAQGKMTAEQARSMLTRMQSMDLSKFGAGPERGEGAPPEPPAS